MSKALVVLSGGQDSSTCLAVARQEFEEVHAITFDYCQRHRIEIDSAIAVALALGVASHEVICLGEVQVLKGTSGLVSDNPIGQYESAEQLPGGVEPTFIPARNALFLTIAANRAAVLGIEDIFIGVCEADYGGYYDCRSDFIYSMAIALSRGIYGTDTAFRVHTPLMHLTKVETVKLAHEVLGNSFAQVMALTHTCYQGVKGGCGKCHACLLRDRGFKQAGIDDPLWQFRKVAA